MASYQYVAVNSSGKQKRGKIDADSPKAARSKVRELGLMPVSISEISAQAVSAGKGRGDPGEKKFSL